MKYGTWKTAQPAPNAVNALVAGGYAPLAAMVLASRGLGNKENADKYLDCDAPLCDPFLMTDMAMAAGRVAVAMAQKEKIAVFGDYDVDGITATCLLTDFLRKQGCDCVPYIPGRLEEGYGLNPIAIEYLADLGVKLIITVDCGITAVEEARLCKEKGIDLVITDHHECKDTLPEAIAVVDPHRPDCTYPHKTLSGVGVAFKLASALAGDQEKVLTQYADMVCLGTVADVMPLQGENRAFVSRGVEMLRDTTRPGLKALMDECGCTREQVSASVVGYMLSPRINAAGRMGQIELAIELFLTDDVARGEAAAKALCELNKQRQAVESEIYRQATEMLPEGQTPEAIVLADESWHQGVVGIVASRIAEEYSCPAFLICLDGEHGKASSRSFGGFNLFGALTSLSHLLESYGGHELAAGFTIHKDQIPAFRQEICRLAKEFYQDAGPKTVLEADCVIPPELLTLPNIQSLDALEPCGTGCPKPVLVMEGLTIDKLSAVGNGRHLRLRLQKGNFAVNGIFFSTTAESASVELGDRVDVAFQPQINEFRGEKSVQMNVQDIRPSCNAPLCCEGNDYRLFLADKLTPDAAARLIPDRATQAMVWRYLALRKHLRENPICLLRKIVRWADQPLSLDQMLVCLAIFADVGLLETARLHNDISVRILPASQKADLNTSRTMQKLLAAAKEN